MTRNAERQLLENKSAIISRDHIWTLYNTNFTFLMMVMVALVLNSPTLIVWAKDIRYIIYIIYYLKLISVDSKRNAPSVCDFIDLILNVCKDHTFMIKIDRNQPSSIIVS